VQVLLIQYCGSVASSVCVGVLACWRVGGCCSWNMRVRMLDVCLFMESREFVRVCVEKREVECVCAEKGVVYIYIYSHVCVRRRE